MGSLVGSTANSLFMKVGSVFGANKITQSESGVSAGATSKSDVDNIYRRGPTSDIHSNRAAANNIFKGSQTGASEASNGYWSGTGSDQHKLTDVNLTAFLSKQSNPTKTFRSEEVEYADTSRSSNQHDSDYRTKETRAKRKDANRSEAGYSESKYSEYSDYSDSRSNRKKRHDEFNHDGASRDESRTKRSRNTEQKWYREQSETPVNQSGGDPLGARAVQPPKSASYEHEPRFGKSTQRGPATMMNRNPVSYNQSEGSMPEIKDLRGQNFSLGARPLGETEQTQYKEKLSLDSTAELAGLYDVFAPSGPIGIVVDTTKEGPSVHSLKSTSPMLGLINPGDLIIALDDEDTRNMTAATLTRLMAKKSRQKERKITLLAFENY
jgi:hypothetical protein